MKCLFIHSVFLIFAFQESFASTDTSMSREGFEASIYSGLADLPEKENVPRFNIAPPGVMRPLSNYDKNDYEGLLKKIMRGKKGRARRHPLEDLATVEATPLDETPLAKRSKLHGAKDNTHGVSPAYNGMWRIQLYFGGINCNLGNGKTKEEARKIYDAAVYYLSLQDVKKESLNFDYDEVPEKSLLDAKRIQKLEKCRVTICENAKTKREKKVSFLAVVFNWCDRWGEIDI